MLAKPDAAGYTERLRVSTCCKLSASHPNHSVVCRTACQMAVCPEQRGSTRSITVIQQPAWTPSRASDWQPKLLRHP